MADVTPTSKRGEISVSIETRISDTWCPPREFDSKETTVEHLNSATRSAVGLRCREGVFRFVIRLGTQFRWKHANGISVVLTLDEGYEVNEHEVVIMRDAEDARQLQLNHMNVESNGDWLYNLECIQLPNDTTRGGAEGLDEVHFAFQTLDVQYYKDNGVGALSKASLSPDFGRVKVQLTPIRVSRAQRALRRPVRSKVKLNEVERQQTRVTASEATFSLETSLRYDNPTTYIPNNPLLHTYTQGGHPKYTFVFLYRGMVDEVEEVTADIVKAGTGGVGRERSASTAARRAPLLAQQGAQFSPTPDPRVANMKQKTLSKPSNLAALEASSEPEPDGETIQVNSPYGSRLRSQSEPRPRHEEQHQAQSPPNTHARPEPALEAEESTRSMSPAIKNIVRMLEKGDTADGKLRNQRLALKREFLEEREYWAKQLQASSNQEQSWQARIDEATERLNAMQLESKEYREQYDQVNAQIREVEQELEGEQDEEVMLRMQELAQERLRKRQDTLKKAEKNIRESKKRRRSQLSSASSTPTRP